MRADTVYVPVVEPVNAAGTPLATQLWISNFDGVERPYATAFLQADRAGAAPKRGQLDRAGRPRGLSGQGRRGG